MSQWPWRYEFIMKQAINNFERGNTDALVDAIFKAKQ